MSQDKKLEAEAEIAFDKLVVGYEDNRNDLEEFFYAGIRFMKEFKVSEDKEPREWTALFSDYRDLSSGAIVEQAPSAFSNMCSVFQVVRKGALEAKQKEIDELKENHNLQMAGVMTASMQNTQSTIKDRIDRSNPYWTQAYQDVCDAVDREVKLRQERDDYREALEGIQKSTLDLINDDTEEGPGLCAHGLNTHIQKAFEKHKKGKL